MKSLDGAREKGQRVCRVMERADWGQSAATDRNVGGEGHTETSNGGLSTGKDVEQQAWG